MRYASGVSAVLVHSSADFPKGFSGFNGSGLPYIGFDDRSVISLAHQGDTDALVFDRRRSRLFLAADAGSKARKAVELGVRAIAKAEWRDLAGLG